MTTSLGNYWLIKGYNATICLPIYIIHGQHWFWFDELWCISIPLCFRSNELSQSYIISWQSNNPKNDHKIPSCIRYICSIQQIGPSPSTLVSIWKNVSLVLYVFTGADWRQPCPKNLWIQLNSGSPISVCIHGEAPSKPSVLTKWDHWPHSCIQGLVSVLQKIILSPLVNHVIWGSYYMLLWLMAIDHNWHYL